MSQDIRDFGTATGELLAFGEPTHQEPAFGQIRNELLVQLADLGFRSIVLETDRVAALLVDDYVQDGTGTLDAALSEGFSHGFGELAANRDLLAWLREYNQDRAPADRIAFHGFDLPTETMNAPSPLSYLEAARDYLGFGLDLASLAGPDERWSRTEAVMDPASSPGATPEADRLHALADDLYTSLHVYAPELIAGTSRARWHRAKIQLTAGLALLSYHRQCAKPMEQNARVSALLENRDAHMARNLLHIREIEADRGPTLVFSSNAHLQRNRAHWRLGEMDLSWVTAGSIVSSLLGDRYAFIAGSLGRSAALGLDEPEPESYEGQLQSQFADWGLTRAASVDPARSRAETNPRQGYFPLDQPTLDGADLVLHISAGDPTAPRATRS
ncbi:erythromycin esterase family protein [Crossiella cryophila]|uniref:Erythromycin esterase-like protein n=1 Tax=Crossiella cryophila TaxID=43355 RepID=A0A7W7FWG7_9PSEU|nr:erythromycin esterase family protein [Crossiella cryophila]MBB4680242.1 erythromycin esterase-like protein [Crossiella cryophila]